MKKTLTKYEQILLETIRERYKNLSQKNRLIASEGIARYINASRKCGVEINSETLDEIIRDAKNGRAVYTENDNKKSETTCTCLECMTRRYPETT